MVCMVGQIATLRLIRSYDMKITSAQYKNDQFGNSDSITAIIDGTKHIVPLDPANRHYSEIMRQVEAGTLVIQEAD